MKKTTVFECKEEEIISMIQKSLFPEVDSLVALEELGNQVWVVDVEPADSWDVEQITAHVENGTYPQFLGLPILNYLCKVGYLEAGKYNIDCTW